MDYLQTAKQALAELPSPGSCTSIHGVDKDIARLLRVRISRESDKLGYTVMTRLRGRELVIWRVV